MSSFYLNVYYTIPYLKATIKRSYAIKKNTFLKVPAPVTLAHFTAMLQNCDPFLMMPRNFVIWQCRFFSQSEGFAHALRNYHTTHSFDLLQHLWARKFKYLILIRNVSPIHGFTPDKNIYPYNFVWNLVSNVEFDFSNIHMLRKIFHCIDWFFHWVYHPILTQVIFT